MRNLVSFISEKIADKFAYITDDNEMFYENINKKNITPEEQEEAKKKRIEDIKAYIAALQDELKELEGSTENETLGEVERKAKSKAPAKKAAAQKKKSKRYWDDWNASCGSSSSSGGCGGSSSRRSRSYSSYGGCGSSYNSSSSC